jgi:rare lipoprotein A
MNAKRLIGILLIGVALAGCGGGGNYAGYKWKPYTVRGVYYQPMAPRDAVGYTEEGIASHYKEGWFIFPGKTAIGESMYGWTSAAAHKTLPLPCKVRITNLQNGRSTVVRVSDRGPFIGNRVIDVTAPVAKRLGFYHRGLAQVRIQVLSVGDGRHRIR